MAGAKLQAWDRRAAESAQAFEAFVLYRDAGPGRGMAAVGTELGKSIPLLERWSSRHEWVARAAAYDTEVARRASARTLESDADALARQIEDARAIQADARARFVEAATDSTDMSRVEAARVWAMAAKEEREARRLPAKVEHTGKDGGPIETTELTPAEAIEIMRQRRADKAAAKGKAGA